jgi:hypothetical protein
VTAADGGFTVRWAAIPDPVPTGDPFAIEFELFRDPECATPLADGTLEVDAAMPHHAHGMNLRPKVDPLGPGRYRARGVLFHMPGRWELFFDRTVDGVTERAQTTLTAP